jgi:hypothetical protein
MIDRPITEIIFKDKALVMGQDNIISADIPMGGGQGWFELLLEIALTLVVGTGTGAISEGELGIARSIKFETDIDKESHEAAGRALFRVAHFEKSRAQNKDAIAAASATYRTVYPLIFSDYLSNNPFESILDSARYKSANLIINMGTIADLLSSVGTATVTATCSLSKVMTKGQLRDMWAEDENGESYLYALPKVYPNYRQRQVEAHTNLKTDLPRQADLRIRRLYWMSGTSPVAGVPFSGTPVDDSIKDISIEHDKGYEFKKLDRRQLAQKNINDFKLSDTRPVGWYALDFMEDGDLKNALLTDPNFVSKLEMNWATESATAANINMILNGMKSLKPIGR